MLLIWHLVLPDEAAMKELELAFPDQHKYIKTNLLYYVISVSCWGGALLVSCCLWKAGGVLASCIGLWYLYIIIWNLTQTSTVNDKRWADVAAASDPATDFGKIHTTMMWMYWLRIVPLMLIGCACVCGCCMLVITALGGAKNQFS